jgi:ribonuclease HIII
LLAWSHAKAIEEVLLKVNCEVILTDQFGNERYLRTQLQEKAKNLKLIQRMKGERHIAIAAASVLARAGFLSGLKRLSDGYNLNLSRGASMGVVADGKQIVRTYGKDSLGKVAKLHFRTTKKVLGF